MDFDKDKISHLYPEAENLMISPMLYWSIPEGKENMLSRMCQNGLYFAEKKVDGALYQFVKTDNYHYLFSRSVSKQTGLLTEKSRNVPHIMDALNVLPSGTILVGEVYYPGGESKNTVEIMGCLPNLAIKRQQNNLIHYYLFDILYYEGINLMNTGAENRYKILRAIWDKYNLSQYPFLECTEAIYDNIEELAYEFINNGGEGFVLKKKDGIYEPDKRPAWRTIKIKKSEDEIDLVCCGFVEPTKEYTGKEIESWNLWQIENPDDGSLTLKEGSFYKDSLDPIYGKLYIPVTKPFYYRWKSGMEVGAYNKDGKLVKIGTVASGLTDEDKEGMTKRPEEYLNHVFKFSAMSKDKDEKTLRHPQYIGPHPDKNPLDCKLDEIFNLVDF